ncbi:RNA polymerase recycling motor HelD [Evansella sp. AB-P1]|uniref:RNA polymerase recycling motor HelD n=1 Tax=Evansella sp. AB-P1 TaxID=3037653 RepID=UPI00241D74D1|nr:RNA polymerase recycling motor HelD [Evansella sp. AB-P1]MDG5788780.1 RNA polymerase recycling motor HelD [Evansella sp. AB-P1]
MSISNEEWNKEKKRVETIIDVINNKINHLQENVGTMKEGVIDLRKSFWEDVTVNLDDAHEVGETFTSIKQQAELLSERERTHEQFYKKMKNLIKLSESPYFGRIDFLEKGEEGEEVVYIGLASLMDEKDENFLVYDWRAPISSLYYNYSPGPAKYEVPSEVIEGEVQLKRQYIIKNGKLKSMFDTGVTIGDELLQEVLSNNANTQMKSIVATIQREQNLIIRNEKSKFLIVQGVAGSGKTSAALQRVAYLLYRYRGQINSDNIMLFSPNYLFNSYVATVLPELGEDNMKQTTFQAYLQTRLEKEFTIEDPFSQMEYLYTAIKDSTYETRMASIKYKSSVEFKHFIDQFIQYLSREGIVFKNISLRGKVIISNKEIEKYFYSLDETIAIPNRMNLVAEWILVTLAKIEKNERKKDWVIEESELLDKEDYLKTFQETQKGNRANADNFDDYALEEKMLSKFVVRKYFKPIRNAVKKLRFMDTYSLYKKIFDKDAYRAFYSKSLPHDLWDEICRLTMKKLEGRELMYEDTTAFLYLKDQLEGRKSNTMIRHLFIDEAQDYSPFQFEFLKQLFPNCKMTILGDVNQAIYAHGNDSPTLLSEQLFKGKDQSERITLTRSYRSTRQIVEFTKGVIQGGELIEPFNRDGDKPTLTTVRDSKDLKVNISHRVKLLEQNGHKTIAILCKTMKESEEAYNNLKDDLQLQLVDKDTTTFNKGVLVLPAYLAKGIEFDGVIIYNASSIVYGEEQERKLFYTSCTRAMHELHLFTVGKKSYFFDDIRSETYNEIQIVNECS